MQLGGTYVRVAVLGIILMAAGISTSALAEPGDGTGGGTGGATSGTSGGTGGGTGGETGSGGRDPDHPLGDHYGSLRSALTPRSQLPDYNRLPGESADEHASRLAPLVRAVGVFGNLDRYGLSPDTVSAFRAHLDSARPQDRPQLMIDFADAVRSNPNNPTAVQDFVTRLTTGSGGTGPGGGPSIVGGPSGNPGPTIVTGDTPRGVPPGGDPPRTPPGDPPRTPPGDPPRTPPGDPPRRTGDPDSPTRTADAAKPPDSAPKGPIGISTEPPKGGRPDIVGPALSAGPNDTPVLLGRHRLGGGDGGDASLARGGAVVSEAEKNAPLLSMPFVVKNGGAGQSGGAAGGRGMDGAGDNGSKLARNAGDAGAGGSGSSNAGGSSPGSAAGVSGSGNAGSSTAKGAGASAGANGALAQDSRPALPKSGPQSFAAYLGKSDANAAAGAAAGTSAAGSLLTNSGGKKALAALAAQAAMTDGSNGARGFMGKVAAWLRDYTEKGEPSFGKRLAGRFLKPLAAALTAWDSAGAASGVRALLAGTLTNSTSAAAAAGGTLASLLLALAAHRLGWQVTLGRRARARKRDDDSQDSAAA